MRYQDEPFFQYPTTTFVSSAGDVALPILYFDTSNFVAMFWVDYARAAALMDDPGLQLVRFRGNKALVSVAWFEYRETSVGVYNEVGVAMAVVPKGMAQPRFPLLSLYGALDQRQIGMYILDLPVTTAAACAAGREVWGYPKFVTQISFQRQGQRFKGVVTDPDRDAPLVTLSGEASRLGLPTPPMSLVLYSRRHDGVLVRAHVNVRGWMSSQLPGTMVLQVGDSQQVMAQHLHGLGLNGARPFIVQRTDAFQSRLNAGAVLPGQVVVAKQTPAA